MIWFLISCLISGFLMSWGSKINVFVLEELQNKEKILLEFLAVVLFSIAIFIVAVSIP